MPLIGVVMIATVTAVGALAWWDEKRESADALEDFAQEQARLATSLAGELAVRLSTRADASLPELVAGVAVWTRPDAVILIAAPPYSGFRAADGRDLRSLELQQALASDAGTLRLAPESAAALGLPERTAMAGLARVRDGPLGSFGVAVVASARRERDRGARARMRLVLAVALAAMLVLGFGGLALRHQRKQLLLERELAVAEVIRERDERLARLGRAAMMVTLASGVAHEVSTPLGVISGRAEQIQSRLGGDERAQRSLQLILEQIDRIKQTIRGFLELARGGTPVLQEESPALVVEGARSLVEHRFDEAGVLLRVTCAPELPVVRCDPRLLEHALVNLLLNACDASRRGGGVEASVHLAGDLLCFVVSDAGEGIAPAHLARLAEPFFTTKPPGRGTGLGLAIASEIAKIHRGTLAIGPALPRGTQARLLIPLASGESDA